MMGDLFTRHRDGIAGAQPIRTTGYVIEVSGWTIVARGLAVPVGTICKLEPFQREPIHLQVVAAREDRIILLALQEPLGVAPGDPVTSTTGHQTVPVGRQMLGSILDGLGRPIGGRMNFTVEAHYPVYVDAPPALSREPVVSRLITGVRAIDAMHTIGGGQRVGVFAGTGVGKSVLMGMIARSSSADVIVVALVGERGREVGDFIRKDLGDEGLARSVMVVSTSDESPVLRVRAAFAATAVAEYFRDLGRDVLLLMDSTTRMAMAQRQIGLAAGEPPTTKGYPPSTFALLPRLLERSGRSKRGSITGFYMVLVEGDDINEPVSDAIRGILDGHLWLSRDLANRAHYPAISVLESISRVMPDVVDQEHKAAADEVRRLIAVWNDIEDLVNVGAYSPGSNVEFDVAVEMKPAIDDMLRQGMKEVAQWSATRKLLIELADEARSLRTKLTERTAPTAVRKAS